VSFSKTPLLVIVSRVIVYDKNVINNSMLVENNNKWCCINIREMLTCEGNPMRKLCLENCVNLFF
jgi:hypothetical protein